MSEGQFKMQPVSDYKTSSYYRSIRHFLDQGDLGTALQEATNLCHNEQPVEHLENFASMVEVLQQAHQGGDASDELKTKFETTVEQMFQLMQERGLIRRAHAESGSLNLYDEQ